MDKERVQAIMKNKEKCDVYYNEEPVWIQEINDNVAKVGFIRDNIEKDVFIQDLYERNLYN